MKNSIKKSLKASNGITLIALVITIIVLLILAGVSITMLAGNNSILRQATTAKERTGEKQIEERIGIAYNSAIIEDIHNSKGKIQESTLEAQLAKEFPGSTIEIDTTTDTTGKKWYVTIDGGTPIEVEAGKTQTVGEDLEEITDNTPAGVAVRTPTSWTTLQGKAMSDGNGTAIPLPEGFYYVGGDISNGLVISDNINDSNKGTSYTVATSLVGNQFVWIPVADESAMTRTDFDEETGQPLSYIFSSGYLEPYERGYSDGNGTEETLDYNTMKNQVLSYGGFYIGRYEAGVDSNILRTQVTTDQEVVCRKGVAPYDYIPWGESISNINTAFVPMNNNPNNVFTHGAVYLSKNMYATSNSVTSTLVYGCQWDAMCRYIGDANRKTPLKNSPGLTASVETDVSKNIYDLAGNCSEWTMETCIGAFNHAYRSNRGGCDNLTSSAPVANRMYSGETGVGDTWSFRVTLYVK